MTWPLETSGGVVPVWVAKWCLLGNRRMEGGGVGDVLTGLGDDPTARPALDHGFVRGFCRVDDSAYDDIRAMQSAMESAGWTSLTQTRGLPLDGPSGPAGKPHA